MRVSKGEIVFSYGTICYVTLVVLSTVSHFRNAKRLVVDSNRQELLKYLSWNQRESQEMPNSFEKITNEPWKESAGEIICIVYARLN